jgi:hypothetical protein
MGREKTQVGVRTLKGFNIKSLYYKIPPTNFSLLMINQSSK